MDFNGVGIGISDFKALRLRKNYFIDKTKNSFIIEFKVADDMQERTVEEVLENAKKQIEEKQYESNLKERGFNNITKMVFAFKGKEFKMEVV